MTEPNFASVRVTYLFSEAIGSYTDPAMQWSIRRETVRHNIADRARFVEVVCGWHEGGHPKYEYPDPLLHCTFISLDDDSKFISKLHAYPESVISSGMSEISNNWWVKIEEPGRNQQINNAYRLTGGQPSERLSNDVYLPNTNGVQPTSSHQQDARAGPSTRPGPPRHQPDTRAGLSTRPGISTCPDVNSPQGFGPTSQSTAKVAGIESGLRNTNRNIPAERKLQKMKEKRARRVHQHLRKDKLRMEMAD